SNGDPMTADDVKFSLERFLSSASKTINRQTLSTSIGSIDVVDPLTIKLTMKSPLIDLPYLLTANEGIVLPSKYIAKVGWADFAKQPIGSGPYTLVDHKAGQSVTYRPNTSYWGSAKPSLKEIKLLAVPEEQTRIALLESGKADLADISATSSGAVQKAGFKTVLVPATYTYAIYFAGAYGNYKDTPVKKLAVRKALALALDKKAILNALSPGQGEVANQASVADASQGVPDMPPTPYDPNQAKQLLQQAGYPKGFTFKFYAWDSLGCSSETAKEFAQAVAGYWQKIGVTTEITPASITVMRPKIFGKPVSPDVVGAAFDFCPGGGEPLRTLALDYYSKGTLHATDVADGDIENALKATSPQEQIRLVGSAYRKIYNDYSTIPVLFAGHVFAADGKLAGYPTTRGTATMLLWWITPRPASK
ncbi:MAG: ABC transporter substrate-binding protein, partial [Chloroflexota bacterium]|nr:ABC transporter substrate-binding protein [Chloroflexota bacterium]